MVKLHVSMLITVLHNNKKIIVNYLKGHGGLTIVRRSSNRKNIGQFEENSENFQGISGLLPHNHNSLNVNTDAATTSTSQTIISDSVERSVESKITNSSISKFVYMLPRENQAQTTSAASLNSAEKIKFVDCASDNDSCSPSNTTIAMTSPSNEYKTELLPSVDTPDACDKAAHR